MVLNNGPLDWESSTLTMRPLLHEISEIGEISGLRHFIYCFVCVLLCICSFIDIDITGRDNGVEFGIYIFIPRDVLNNTKQSRVQQGLSYGLMIRDSRVKFKISQTNSFQKTKKSQNVIVP